MVGGLEMDVNSVVGDKVRASRAGAGRAGALKSPVGCVYAAGTAEKPPSETAAQPGCEDFEKARWK